MDNIKDNNKYSNKDSMKYRAKDEMKDSMKEKINDNIKVSIKDGRIACMVDDYIDALNCEKKPAIVYDESFESLPELAGLCGAARLVKSLREPAMPDEGFANSLAASLKFQAKNETDKKASRGITAANENNAEYRPSNYMPADYRPAERVKRKRLWVKGLAGVAAILVLVFAFSLILPILFPDGGINIVSAMGESYDNIQAYHGFLKIIGRNEAGEESVQAELEVWADRTGSYYVKQLSGAQKGTVTVNNGSRKWQVRSDTKEIYILPSFPDAFRFTFELGNEINSVRNAIETKVIAEENVDGRKASVVEVTPAGGSPYKIWIDHKTRLPVKKQRPMQNALQYEMVYSSLEFGEKIPAELMSYSLPAGFKEIDGIHEQLVASFEEATEAVKFEIKIPAGIPQGFVRESIAVATDSKTVKLQYKEPINNKQVIILQKQATDSLEPASTAILGKVGEHQAEIQSPVQESSGVLSGGGVYAGVTDVSSIRWQSGGYEYAVAGNAAMEELVEFVKSLGEASVEVPETGDMPGSAAKVKVPVDLEIEKNEQKSVDAGHSPWKLDPVFVAQVFVSLKISPDGIIGDYPVRTEELKLIENTGSLAVVEVSSDKSPVARVYLERLIRQDSTGIWIVTGYDPAE